MNRESSVRSLFQAVAKSPTGNVVLADWLWLAKALNINKPSKELEAEYVDICARYNLERASGLNLKAFSSVINDKDEEWYVPDEKIGVLLQTRQAQNAEQTNAASQAQELQRQAQRQASEKALSDIARRIAELEKEASEMRTRADHARVGEGVLKMLEQSCKTTQEAMKLQIEAQFEALRSAETAIAVAARQLDADRKAFEEGRRQVLEALESQRSALSKDAAKDFNSFQFSVAGMVPQKGQPKTATDSSPEADPTAYCISCKAELIVDSEFCLSCGAKQPLQSDKRFTFPDGTFVSAPRLTEPEELKMPLLETITEVLAESPEEGPAYAIICGGHNDIYHDSIAMLRADKKDAATFVLNKSCKLSMARALHACVVLSDRRLMMVGGTDGTKALQSTEILDLAHMNFGTGPRMSAHRQGCAAVAMDKFQVLVVGGSDGTNSLNSTEVLNLASCNFAPGPKMISARWGCAAVNLDGERVLIVGGRVGTYSLNTTELFDVDTFTISAGPKLSSRRHGCAAVRLTVDRMLVIGGSEGSEYFNSTEELNLKTMTFNPGPKMNTKRAFCAAVMLDENRLLVAGGFDGTNRLNSCEILDLAGAAGSEPCFARGPALDMPRSSPVAILAPHIPPGSDASGDSVARAARMALLKQIFEALSTKSPGFVLEGELQLLGDTLGIQHAEWTSDFVDLCGENIGLDFDAFLKMISDTTKPFYCTGHQLSRVLGELEHLRETGNSQVKKPAREEMPKF